MWIPEGGKVLTEEDRRLPALSAMSAAGFQSWVAENGELIEARRDQALGFDDLPSGDRGASRIHGYKNYLHGETPVGKVSWCGQSAVATIWDYWGFDPGYAGPRVVRDPFFPSGPLFWHDDTIMCEIVNRFPNDIGGASPNRLCDAFRAAGFENGWSWGPQTTYETIAPYVNNSVPIPVICLLNWGGSIESLHWVCVFALSDGKVWFTNPALRTCNDSSDPAQLSAEGWRVASLSYEDFGNAWGWTGLTKCHLVAFRRG